MTLLGSLFAACGGRASTCSELADETIDLAQRLIDEVEDDIGDMTMDEILAAGGGGLPSLDRFRERAEAVNERAAELGCTQSELRALVQERVGELEATTPIGRLIVDGIRSGGL
jgi:hypothetical protein